MLAFLCFFELNCVFMGIFRIYFACMVNRYPFVEVNPVPRAVGPTKCRIMFQT